VGSIQSAAKANEHKVLIEQPNNKKRWQAYDIQLFAITICVATAAMGLAARTCMSTLSRQSRSSSSMHSFLVPAEQEEEEEEEEEQTFSAKPWAWWQQRVVAAVSH